MSDQAPDSAAPDGAQDRAHVHDGCTTDCDVCMAPMWNASVEHGGGRFWCVATREASATQRFQRRVGHKTHRTEMAALTCATMLARRLNDES